MKKTFKQIREFANYGGAVIERHPGTKISYAIKKVLEKLSKIVNEYNDMVEDINIDHCFADDNGVIEYDLTKNNAGGEIRHYRFTKEELKKKNKADRKLLDEWADKKFDVDPHYATKIPDNLTTDEKECFEGFVLRADETPVVPLSAAEQPISEPQPK